MNTLTHIQKLSKFLAEQNILNAVDDFILSAKLKNGRTARIVYNDDYVIEIGPIDYIELQKIRKERIRLDSVQRALTVDDVYIILNMYDLANRPTEILTNNYLPLKLTYAILEKEAERMRMST